MTITPPPGLGPATYTIGVTPSDSVTMEKLGPTRFRADTHICTINVYAFDVIATLPNGDKLRSATVDAYGCVPPGPVSRLATTGGPGYVDVTWFPPDAPGTSVDQVAYALAWVDDNNASGGPNSEALVGPDQMNASKGFSYRITALMGTHVLIGIEPLNGSGTGTLTTTEDTAWNLSQCTSPAMTCTYNHTEGVALESSAGGTATSTVLPGTPDGTFGAPVTVLCQSTNGPVFTLPAAPWAPSTVWDEVSYGGTTGYVSDLLISTANSMLTSATPQYSSC